MPRIECEFCGKTEADFPPRADGSSLPHIRGQQGIQQGRDGLGQTVPGWIFLCEKCQSTVTWAELNNIIRTPDRRFKLPEAHRENLEEIILPERIYREP